MIKLILILCLIIGFALLLAIALMGSYKNGFEDALNKADARLRDIASHHPLMTAEEVYSLTKNTYTDEDSRQN